MTTDPTTIAILGGTGALGAALAGRWLAAGHRVVIGSRDAQRAEQVATALAKKARVAADRASGATNRDAAAAAEIVVLSVPWSGHRAMLDDVREAVQGKIVLDTTVPLVPRRVARVQLPAGGSAAKTAQDYLGDGVRVVSAFHSVAAHRLAAGEAIESDVLVFGNDPAARAAVCALVEDVGLKPWHGGSIDNSAASEALTSVLIFINRRYGIDGAGFRITGTPGEAKSE
jgi:8-hydroxy-5-deazaflavin:NADPH oxidoreductase